MIVREKFRSSYTLKSPAATWLSAKNQLHEEKWN
jgi:hypothetical protein